MAERTETWDSFWGHLLRIDFFEKQWEMYHRVADARAAWLEETFELDKSQPLLSLACGEGGIELALAKRGFNVTAIDRCASVVHFAREQAQKDNLSATFIVGDIQRDNPLPGNNGTVVCFDTLGLLSAEDESKAITRMVGALAAGGSLLIDTPKRESIRASRNWWEVAGGHLLMDSRWDKDASLQAINPMLIEADGTRVKLVDPYDNSREEHEGVMRYIYSESEATALVLTTGLPARTLGHQRKGYAMIVGSERLAAEE